MENNQLYFKKDWFKNPNFNGVSKYGDTDSIFILLTRKIIEERYGDKLPTNRDEIINMLDTIIDVILEIGKDIQDNYYYITNNIFCTNADPEYNLMDAKLEVIALGAMHFAKKYYIDGPKIYDEGTRFSNILNEYDTVQKLKESGNFNSVIKKKGGVLVKSDTSEISRLMMKEAYEYIVQILFGEIEYSEHRYKMHLKMVLLNKYKNKLKEYLFNKEYDKICQIKKYPNKELKTIPKHVLAAKLWNTLVTDKIREGNSFYMLDIVINDIHTFKYKISLIENKNEYMLHDYEIDHKLTQIAIPILHTKEELHIMEDKFQEYNISIDLDTLIDFNLIKKINQLIIN